MRSPEGYLAIGGLIVFTAWLLIGLPWLIGPVERVVYYENPQPAAHASAGEPNGTPQAPYVVQVLPSRKTAEERTQEALDRAEKQNADLWLVRWTATVAFFTLGLIGATIFLTFSTRLQARITLAIESPIPLVLGAKLVEFTQIPGETVVRDPIPAGPIPQNCRFIFALENKGRTHLRLKELCIEKFTGVSLPLEPVYQKVIPWNGVLEKGPLWIRAAEHQIVVSPNEVQAANQAYQAAGAFWFYGYFTYLDLLGGMKTQKFLLRWDHTHAFLIENRPGYV